MSNEEQPNPFITTEPSTEYPGGKVLEIHYPDGVVARVKLNAEQVATLIASLAADEAPLIITPDW